VLLSGDDHDLRMMYDGHTAMAEAGQDALSVVAIDLTIAVKTSDGKRQVSWRPQFRMLDSAAVTPDPAMLEVVKGYEAELSRELDVEVATLAAPLDSRNATVRAVEAAIGNLIADAARAAVKADIGVINGGGIRGGKEYPAGHKLTRRDIITELPFGPGKRFLPDAKGVARQIVAGWQVSGIYSWRSGYAFTPVVGNQSRFNAFWFAAPVWRPNRLQSGTLSDPNQKAWFDVSAFRQPADYTFGTSGRNILRGPGEFLPDIDISKSFSLTESKILKFRASLLNGLNVANLGTPVTAIDNPLAGQIFSVSTLMRRVEFGLHLYF
jgi:hypothetical protein